MASVSTNVFKVGRTTGLTGGTVDLRVPAAHRLKHARANLHHRGFVVYPPPSGTFFCRPGDSGSWCLNRDGDVVAMLLEGNDVDGTGLVVPFTNIVEDIAMELGVDAGAIKFA